MSGGIVQCFQVWDVGYCWEKLVQFIIDIVMLFLSSFQLFLHCRAQFSFCRVKYWLYYIIILTIFSNFLHQLLFRLYFLFDLSIFFFNIYFTSILYYTGIKLVQNTKNQKIVRNIILGLYWLINILHFALFIASLFTNQKKCIDLWYIIVRTIGVFLAIGLCIIGKFHQNRANKKLEQLGQIRMVNNPMPRLWCWVSINIASQFINLIRTFIFAFVKSLGCQYDKNNREINFLIELLMLLITFYFPMASTLYIFWQAMDFKKTRMESFAAEQENQNAGIQLIAMGQLNRDSL